MTWYNKKDVLRTYLEERNFYEPYDTMLSGVKSFLANRNFSPLVRQFVDSSNEVYIKRLDSNLVLVSAGAEILDAPPSEGLVRGIVTPAWNGSYHLLDCGGMPPLYEQLSWFIELAHVR